MGSLSGIYGRKNNIKMRVRSNNVRWDSDKEAERYGRKNRKQKAQQER